MKQLLIILSITINFGLRASQIEDKFKDQCLPQIKNPNNYVYDKVLKKVRPLMHSSIFEESYNNCSNKDGQRIHQEAVYAKFDDFLNVGYILGQRSVRVKDAIMALNYSQKLALGFVIVTTFCGAAVGLYKSLYGFNESYIAIDRSTDCYSFCLKKYI